jgi:hypothetical protein
MKHGCYKGEDGRETWWEDGKLHRLDAPAVIDPNGDMSWYVQGKCVAALEEEELVIRIPMSSDSYNRIMRLYVKGYSFRD